MPTTLHHAGSYWGVVVLVGLLLSIPWLPIDSAGGRNVAAPDGERSIGAAVRQPVDERLTFYIVSTHDEAAIQIATIDPSKEAVVLVQSAADQARLDVFLTDINGARSSAGVPPLTIVDLR